MKKVQVAVFAVIPKDGKYLLSKRIEEDQLEFHDRWQIPGGGHEFAESPIDTLHREVREELGIEVVEPRLIPVVFTRVARGAWQGIFLCYLCRMKDEQQKITLNEEASEWGWFTLSEIEKLQTLDGVAEVIKEAEKIINS